MNAEVRNNLIVRLWDKTKILKPPGPVGSYGDNMDNNMDNDVGDVLIYLVGGGRNIDLIIE